MADESSGNRADMVEAARKFMLTPKVASTPFEEQRQFLLGKGVSESEIAEARASIPQQALTNAQVAANVPAMQNGPMYMAPPPQNKYVSFAQSALVIGSISYAGYRFLRSFVLPRFFDIPDPATEELRLLQCQVTELQNSIKFVMDSVSQTTSALAVQQQEISRALLSVNSRDADLSGIRDGINTIKGLLVAGHNFAPIVTPAVTSIPSWQQAGTVSHNTTMAGSGYLTPPANFKDANEEFEEASSQNGLE